MTQKMTHSAQNINSIQGDKASGDIPSQLLHQTESKVEIVSRSSQLNKQVSSEKDKKIKKKPDSIIEKLRLEKPLFFGHVVNYLNMLGINERALQNNHYEESFYRSMFYIKTVQKVQLRKHALIIYFNSLHSQPVGFDQTIVETLIDRLCSLGDRDKYHLALQIKNTFEKYQCTDFKSRLTNCFESEPLSRFIERMHDKIYMCRIAPGKLIISRALLNLIGQDPEAYALELCKFKTARREIISSQNYTSIMTKSVQNLGSLCDFLNQQITYQTLQEHTTSEFYDQLFTRNYKKIPCKFRLSMPSPLINLLEAIELGKQGFNSSHTQPLESGKSLLDSEIKNLRYRESQSLRHIIKLQDNMLSENKHLVAGYVQAYKTPA